MDAMSKLKGTLKIGTVELNVKDLEVMKKFYTEIIGLNIIKEDSRKVTLGKDNLPLLTLHHQKHLDKAHPAHAGLYHFAIVYSSRGDLAKTLENIFKKGPESFTGSGDHLVSEAFYFNDPEGNGIELYYDRDRKTWQWENGSIKMATLYIDPVEYVQRYIVLEEKNTITSVGHIHLKVGDIEKARQFYVDILGFEITAEMPSALFVSVGGYHHHIGMNTWESFGASERNETLGLKKFQFIVAEDKEVEEIKKRLKEHDIAFEEHNSNSITFNDPWKNKIEVTYI